MTIKLDTPTSNMTVFPSIREENGLYSHQKEQEGGTQTDKIAPYTLDFFSLSTFSVISMCFSCR
jgi:hypothetical protein